MFHFSQSSCLSLAIRKKVTNANNNPELLKKWNKVCFCVSGLYVVRHKIISGGAMKSRSGLKKASKKNLEKIIDSEFSL